ncbi:MAG: FAD-dependent oxidoreductase [Rhizobiales bacterium]|nr:FAD-dependent oxidoreductase [Hyphomicrobiales bacterium]
MVLAASTHPAKAVTIIGAGPTGLSAALALATRGVTVTVLERNGESVKQSRAVALNRASLEHLATVGASAAILARAARPERVRMYDDGRLLAVVTLPRTRKGQPIIVALPQSSTEAILVERLRELGIAVHWRTMACEIVERDDGVTVVAETPTGLVSFCSDYVLGADGSHSLTRCTLGLSFEGKAYPGDWQLFDAVLDWPWPDCEAAAFFGADGAPMFMITLGDGRHRIIGVGPELEARAAAFVGIGEISWRNDFTLAERRVRSYGRGRLWLAGDAAHVHSPVGGQGMNLGIDDAFDFAESLVAGDFAGYERRRIAKARRVMGFVDFGFGLITARSPSKRAARNTIIRVAAASGALRNWALRRLLGTGD